MCITLASARLFATNIGFVANYITGQHILLYQNSFENEAASPNAMVLPIPGSELEFSDTRNYDRILEDLGKTLKRTSRSTARSLMDGQPKSIQVVEVGSYHIVIAERANVEAIQTALASLPEKKRPTFNDELIQWYLDFYGSDVALAICCFDSSAKAEPIQVTYKPLNFSIAFFPGADSHDGSRPRMGEWVDRDHNLFLGEVSNNGDTGDDFNTTMVRFSQGDAVPEVFRKAVWRHVADEVVTQTEGRNCDWVITLGAAGSNVLNEIKEVTRGLRSYFAA